MDVLTETEIRVLAERAYPGLKPSGLCSRLHHEPGTDVSCQTCYPDLWALIIEHNRLKHLAWDRLRELGEDLPK